MLSFGTILKRFRPWAAQTLQMISFSSIWDLGPKTAQKLLIASSGTILDHPDTPNEQCRYHFKPFLAQGNPAAPVLVLHFRTRSRPSPVVL